jgi:hypothetical protein
MALAWALLYTESMAWATREIFSEVGQKAMDACTQIELREG